MVKVEEAGRQSFFEEARASFCAGMREEHDLLRSRSLESLRHLAQSCAEDDLYLFEDMQVRIVIPHCTILSCSPAASLSLTPR